MAPKKVSKWKRGMDINDHHEIAAMNIKLEELLYQLKEFKKLNKVQQLKIQTASLELEILMDRQTQYCRWEITADVKERELEALITHQCSIARSSADVERQMHDLNLDRWQLKRNLEKKLNILPGSQLPSFDYHIYRLPQIAEASDELQDWPENRLPKTKDSWDDPNWPN